MINSLDVIKFLLYYSYLKAQKLQGKTGEMAFNEDGDNEKPIYEVVNTRQDSVKVIGHYGGRQVSYYK